MAVGIGFALFLISSYNNQVIECKCLALRPTKQARQKDLRGQWPVAISVFAVLIARLFEELFIRKQLFARFSDGGHAIPGYLLRRLPFA